MTRMNVFPSPRTSAVSAWPAFDKVVADWLQTPSTSFFSQPLVNIKETEAAFWIELAAPGLAKEDFQVEIDNQLLTISAEKTTEKTEGEKVRRHEYSFNKFRRQFQLPKSVQAENIEAKYEAGILSLQLPKKEEARPQPPRKVAIA